MLRLTEKDKLIIRSSSFIEKTKQLLDHFEDKEWVKEAQEYLNSLM